MSVEVVVLAGYVACLLALLCFSVGQYHLVVLRRRAARARGAGRPAPGPATPAAEPGRDVSEPARPRVTIQLPVYNERYVAARVLRAVAALDYPRDRLDVQVLDDSTDDTTVIVAALLPELRAGGLQVSHVRRQRRVGYKAGALAAGLDTARGELVAVFDADFVPPVDFLQRTVPHFRDPRVGAVQARWGHLNEHESPLTAVEAFLLDLHFGLEQPARSDAGLFLNFNGTAGVWRRAAIADAGGWSARTVTEDIDLSYRAQLRGWRVRYLEELVCPAELPADMGGLRGQQHRWIMGGAQNARLHLRRVLGRTDLPATVRHHAAQHLLAGLTYAVIVLMLLLTVPLAAVKGTAIHTDYADYGVPFVLATGALVATFWDARRPTGLRGRLRFAGLMAAFLVFTMGLSVHNAAAAVRGLFRRGEAEFVRTPKAGSAGWAGSRYAVVRVDRRVLRELAVMAALVVGLVVGVSRHETAFVPVQVMALAGLGWVVTLSVWHPLRVRRAERAHVRNTTNQATARPVPAPSRVVPSPPRPAPPRTEVT